MKMAATFVGAPGFLFDDRRQRDEFFGGAQRQVWHPVIPHLLNDALPRLLHALDDLLAGIAARITETLRKQRALVRHLLDVAGQDLVFAQALHDLL